MKVFRLGFKSFISFLGTYYLFILILSVYTLNFTVINCFFYVLQRFFPAFDLSTSKCSIELKDSLDEQHCLLLLCCSVRIASLGQAFFRDITSIFFSGII